MKYIMQFNALCLLSALEYTSQSCSNKVLFTDEKTHPEEFVPLHLNPKFLVEERKNRAEQTQHLRQRVVLQFMADSPIP
jgi:hypothetical protein